jgi:hypothetical protein
MSAAMQVFVPCHQWHIEGNYATQGTEQECVRCGVHRSTFPGDSGFRQRNPPSHLATRATPRAAKTWWYQKLILHQ